MNRTEECFLNFTECVDRLRTWQVSNEEAVYVLVCGEETMAFTAAGIDKFMFYTLKEALHRNVYGW